VTEFDVKVYDSTGGSFILYGGHALQFTVPIDIEIVLETFDWIPDYPGGPAWDFHVQDANSPEGCCDTA
jgi:hypothetical protein